MQVYIDAHIQNLFITSYSFVYSHIYSLTSIHLRFASLYTLTGKRAGYYPCCPMQAFVVDQAMDQWDDVIKGMYTCMCVV